MQNSSITATVDFDREGTQHGFLTLPYSHDDSAWGNIMIPDNGDKKWPGSNITFNRGKPWRRI